MNKNFNGTNKKFNNNGKNFTKTKEEYEAEKAAQIAKQTKSLDIIDSIAKYLDEFLTKGESNRASMRDLLSHLNDTCGYAPEDTKVVSQFNYLLLELANARKNTRISGDRLNIRVMYIEERLKTSFKRELHEKACGIIDTYTTLFYWDKDADGENYDTIEQKD